MRLVEAAVKGVGWGVPEDVMRLLPGQAFEVEQSLDDKGLPCEKPLTQQAKQGARRADNVHRVHSSAGEPFTRRCTPIRV